MNHQTIPTLAEAKAGAKQFRARMKELGHEVSHSHALEATAAAFRFSDWATFRAAIESHEPAADPCTAVYLLSSLKADLTARLTPLSDRDLFTTAIDLRDNLAAAAIDSLDDPARYIVMYPQANGSRAYFKWTIGETIRVSALAHLKRSLSTTIADIAVPRLRGHAVKSILSNADFLEECLDPYADKKIELDGRYTFGGPFFVGLGLYQKVAKRDVSASAILSIAADDSENQVTHALSSTKKDRELANHLLDQLKGLGMLTKIFDTHDFVRTEIDAYFGGDHARVLTPNVARYVDPDVFNDIRRGRISAAHIVGRGYRHAVTLPDGIWHDHHTLVKKLVSENLLTGISEAWSSFAPSLGNSHAVSPAFLLFRNDADARVAAAQIAGSEIGNLPKVREWDLRSMGDDQPMTWEAILAGKPLPDYE
jgi:hypothetical protein